MAKVFWEDKKSLVNRGARQILKIEIAPGIVCYENVMPSESFDTFVNDLEDGMRSAKINWEAAQVKSGDSESKVDTNSRDTQQINVPFTSHPKTDYSNFVESFKTSLSNIFLENCGPIEKDYQTMYNVNYPWHDSYTVLKYGIGQKFVNHVDDFPDPQLHRRISTLYYLNDNYSGGEINFPRFNISFKPKENQMILFPSTYVYNHSVSPVTEGERYAVVSWIR